MGLKLHFTVGKWTMGWVPVRHYEFYLGSGQTVHSLLYDFWKEDDTFKYQAVDPREKLVLLSSDIRGWRLVKRFRLSIVKLQRKPR